MLTTVSRAPTLAPGAAISDLDPSRLSAEQRYRTMSKSIRKCAIVAFAAILATLALAATAQAGTLAPASPQHASQLVQRHQSTFYLPDKACDRLVEKFPGYHAHLRAGRCPGIRESITVRSHGPRPSAGLNYATQTGSWNGPGNWYGGNVVENFTPGNGVYYNGYTTCNWYYASGFGVNVTWCGATGSGTGTLTSGDNFTISIPSGAGTTGGFRQYITTSNGTGQYCWPGGWVFC
jgi:hypothetical protein